MTSLTPDISEVTLMSRTMDVVVKQSNPLYAHLLTKGKRTPEDLGLSFGCESTPEVSLRAFLK
jgi:hypothetical protein